MRRYFSAYSIADMRILCLDVGTKRIGVAATDPLGLIAQPIGTFTRKGDASDFAEICSRLRDLEASLIIIGIPLDEEGRLGPAAKKMEGFARRLSRHLKSIGLSAPIKLWDERYSTAVAQKRLIEADVSRARRRRVIDKMAAAVILEDYIAANADELGR